MTMLDRSTKRTPAAEKATASAATDAPAEAVAAVTNLVSDDLSDVRAGVSQLIAAKITSPNTLAPAGSKLQVDQRSWQQAGDNASLEATLTSPGRAPVRQRIYLIREAGHWRVLFSEPAA
jgi:hypothetical protein